MRCEVACVLYVYQVASVLYVYQGTWALPDAASRKVTKRMSPDRVEDLY